MTAFLSTLEFKYIGIVALSLFVAYLLRTRKPSPFGLVFSLYCIYLPFSFRFPFTFGFGMNLSNLFLVALLFMSRTKPWMGNDEFLPKLLFAWGFFCIFGFLSAGVTYGTSFLNTHLGALKQWLEQILLYFLARRLVDLADQESVTEGLLLATILVGLDAFLEGMDIGDKVQVGGVFLQPNVLAAFLATYSPLLFASAIFSNAVWRKGLYYTSFAIVCLAILAIQSRGGAIAFLIGAAITASLSKRAVVRVASWGAIVFLFIAPEILPEKILGRFQGTLKETQHQGQAMDDRLERSSQKRVEIWRGAMEMAKDHPLFGVGLDAFKVEIEKYVDLDRTTVRDAHNIYLQVAAELGIPGLLLFLAILYHIIRVGWLASRDVIRLGLVGGIASLMVANFFSGTMDDTHIMGNLWILTGLGSVRVSEEAVELG